MATPCKNCGLSRPSRNEGVYCNDCRRIGGRGIVVGVLLATIVLMMVTWLYFIIGRLTS
jgi:hypothetical protein